MRLRELRQQGYHFRRQSPRGWAILDFVCLKHRLAIEVDGGQHSFDDHARRDAARDRKLAAEGIRTMRFWNAEIDRNLDGVVETIWHALQERFSATPSQES